MLRVLTAGDVEDGSKCNASFADMGAAIDAVVVGNDNDEEELVVEISDDHQLVLGGNSKEIFAFWMRFWQIFGIHFILVVRIFKQFTHRSFFETINLETFLSIEFLPRRVAG